MVMAIAAEQLVHVLSAQNLANMAWAYAALTQPHDKLFTVLDRSAEGRVIDFNSQELANTA